MSDLMTDVRLHWDYYVRMRSCPRLDRLSSRFNREVLVCVATLYELSRYVKTQS